MSNLPMRQDRTDLDDTDENILFERVTRRSHHQGMRIGDFVILKDGDVRRVTFDWGPDVQLTVNGEGGSFYLTANGVMDYSGGLSLPFKKTRFAMKTELREGACWFFHHDRPRAHNGVAASVPCRVFEEVAS
jgi:hypothetical protein